MLRAMRLSLKAVLLIRGRIYIYIYIRIYIYIADLAGVLTCAISCLSRPVVLALQDARSTRKGNLSSQESTKSENYTRSVTLGTYKRTR